MGDIKQPIANRYYLFNFFEKPHDVKVFKEKWDNTVQYIRLKDEFVSTFLQFSRDATARFSWVNFAVLASDDLCCFGKPDPKWKELTTQTMSTAAKAYPAGYREIASFKGDSLTDKSKEKPETTLYFLTAIKVNEKINDEEFEANWKNWAGANVLHGKLGDKAEDTHLYKKFTTNMAPIFRYVTRTEVQGLTDDACHVIANEVNHREGIPEGVETFTSVYQVAITVHRAKDI